MPRICASNFVTFVKASARGKQRLVTRAIANGKWPGYRPRDDYWVRMRNALERLLRSGDFTAGAIARDRVHDQLSSTRHRSSRSASARAALHVRPRSPDLRGRENAP